MFSSLFNWLMGAGRELAVVLISMVPLVELRAVRSRWARSQACRRSSFPLAVIGKMIPIPFYCSSAKAAGLVCARSAAFRLCHQVP